MHCSGNWIESLSSAPIVLPEGKTSLCVRVDPPLHSFLAVQGRNWHAATLTHPSCPLVIGHCPSLRLPLIPPASSCLLVLFGLALAVWLLLALALLLSKRNLNSNVLSELPAGIFDNLGDLQDL